MQLEYYSFNTQEIKQKLAFHLKRTIEVRWMSHVPTLQSSNFTAQSAEGDTADAYIMYVEDSDDATKWKECLQRKVFRKNRENRKNRKNRKSRH